MKSAVYVCRKVQIVNLYWKNNYCYCAVGPTFFYMNLWFLTFLHQFWIIILILKYQHHHPFIVPQVGSGLQNVISHIQSYKPESEPTILCLVKPQRLHLIQHSNEYNLFLLDWVKYLRLFTNQTNDHLFVRYKKRNHLSVCRSRVILTSDVC